MIFKSIFLLAFSGRPNDALTARPHRHCTTATRRWTCTTPTTHREEGLQPSCRTVRLPPYLLQNTTVPAAKILPRNPGKTKFRSSTRSKTRKSRGDDDSANLILKTVRFHLTAQCFFPAHQRRRSTRCNCALESRCTDCLCVCSDSETVFVS